MTVYPVRKHASLSSLHCCLCLCRCVVLHVSGPRAENVTCRRGDSTLRGRKEKAKIPIFTKENYKNNSDTQ